MKVFEIFEDLGEIASASEIYVDMDGVLADFFGEWAKLMDVEHFTQINKVHDIDDALQKIRDTDDFWLRLPMLPEAKNLLNLIKQVKGEYNICSSPLADDPNSEKHKRTWIEQNLSFFPPKNVYITHNKPQYATNEDGTPNILIDDYGKNINDWEAAGGIGFKYKDHKFERTADAIKQHIQEPVNEGPIDWIKKKLTKLAGNYVLNKAEDTFVHLINDPDIKPILDNPELLKQRPEYKAASAQEKEEMIDGIIDLIQLRAQYKSNPDWKKQVMGNIGENSADSKDHIPYQDLIAQAINDRKMTFVNPNTGEEQSVMNPKHVGNRQKELEFKYNFDYPMTKQERLEIRPWVNIPGNKNLMRLPVTQMTMQQAVDWDMLGHPDMPQATIDAARKRYPNDERVKNPTTYKLKSEGIEENFADGKKKGKSRPGRVKRAGASCNGSVTALRKRAKNASGEKARMYHWCANMKSGRKKS